MIHIHKCYFYNKIYKIIDINNYYFYIDEIFMDNEINTFFNNISNE
jgi:hypothetical protein